MIISLLFFLLLCASVETERNTFDKNRTRGGTDGGSGNSLIHEGVIFIFCLLPLSPQCRATGGYSDGEWGQWDRHRGLLATPSRGGAERGGPGVQGNNETAAQNLPEVWEGGWGVGVAVLSGQDTKETETGVQTDSVTKTMCRRGKVMNSRWRHTFAAHVPQLPLLPRDDSEHRGASEKLRGCLCEIVVKLCHLVAMVD